MSGVIQPSLASIPVTNSAKADAQDRDETEDKILTTLEELEGYHIVRAVVRSVVDAKRIVQRIQSYFGVLLDDNNRKPNLPSSLQSQPEIPRDIRRGEKNETRHAISSIDEIYEYADQLLKKTVGYYD